MHRDDQMSEVQITLSHYLKTPIAQILSELSHYKDIAQRGSEIRRYQDKAQK